MNKYLELLIGVVLIILALYVSLPEKFGGLFPWVWASVKTFLIGGIVVGVFCFGLLFLMLGVMDLKE
ncbi:MAG: hypothetical protein QW802_01495 [Candidatus Altiarchaeota archaeon]